MPTGYTAGIIDGDINTFEEFATNCMRAFGATVHMRDEPMDKKYEPREPSSYHTDKIREIKNEIDKIESLSDDEIEQLRMDELRSEIKRHNDALKKESKAEKKLNRILDDVREWNPPTENHKEFKKFMIEQLQKTIEFDGASDWRKEKIQEAEKDMASIHGRFERKNILDKLNKDLEYHNTEHKKELKRCDDANEWVKLLLDSIK